MPRCAEYIDPGYPYSFFVDAKWRDSGKKIHIVVEGATDFDVYSRLFRDKSEIAWHYVKKSTSRGHNNKEVVKNFIQIFYEQRTLQGMKSEAVGIIDSDHDPLLHKANEMAHIIRTDTHDMETLILSRALTPKRICQTMAKEDAIGISAENIAKIEKALEASKEISYGIGFVILTLKIRGWHWTYEKPPLSAETLGMDAEDAHRKQLDVIENWFFANSSANGLLKESGQFSSEVEIHKRQLESEFNADAMFEWLVINGHTMQTLLYIAIEESFGLECSSMTWFDDELSFFSLISKSFSAADFLDTNLGKGLTKAIEDAGVRDCLAYSPSSGFVKEGLRSVMNNKLSK